MSDMLILLAIVGMAGSGKSVASDFFRSQGIPVLRFGDQTDIGLKAAGLPRIEEHERAYREGLRKELGMAAMAIKIEPRIREAAIEHSFIVLDGLYSWEEYLYLRERFPQMKLLSIWAPPALRYDRLAKRTVRSLTAKEAAERDAAELQNLNKGGPMAMADYLIKNDADEATFMNALSDFYSQITNNA